MKRKAIERIPAKKPEYMKAAAKRWVTVQLWEQYLILDLWEPGWKCRHAMDTATGEYGTFIPGSGWNGLNLENAFSDIWTGVRESSFPLAREDKETAKAALKMTGGSWMAGRRLQDGSAKTGMIIQFLIWVFMMLTSVLMQYIALVTKDMRIS